jgi:hypothetical protein
MYYEINVAYNGVHYFATADRSLRTKAEALQMYRHFTRLFPKEMGYTLSLKECMHTSVSIDVDSETTAGTIIWEEK